MNKFFEKYRTMPWVQYRQRELMPHSKAASHCYLILVVFTMIQDIAMLGAVQTQN